VKRHLIYHCWPRTSQLEQLEWHRDRLHKYQHVFTGRRLITFVLDDQTLSPDECRAMFGSDYEYAFLANDAMRSESVSFRHQLSQVYHEEGIVFRAHAKGANYLPGHARREASRNWTEAMYLSCLSNIWLTELMLASSAVAGPCRVDRTVPECLQDTPWHFTGGFYWFRLDKLRECWDSIWQHPLQRNYYFVEILPSLLCPQASEAACLHWSGAGDMYNPQTAKRCLAAIKPLDPRLARL